MRSKTITTAISRQVMPKLGSPADNQPAIALAFLMSVGPCRLLYENGRRVSFADEQKLPNYDWTNVGAEYVWQVRTLGVDPVRLRFDCLNVFNNVGDIRNGAGIGIAVAAYVPPRGFYGGITAVL